MLLGAADINPRLRQLIEAEKANQECADCSTKNPNWASYNIGVFLCEKCCGVHRRIGTHISKPRSVDLDDWTPDHLEAMEIVGNVNAEAYWCYNVPFGRAKPEEGDAMAVITEWIQSKYERKQFCKQPGATSNERSDPGVHVYEKSGWMEKSGGAKEGGKWQPRFFELKDFKLSYYKSQPEPGKKVVAKGIIPITPQVEIRCATNMGVQGEQVQDRMIEGTGFVVRSTEGRDYNFRTETAEEVRTRHLDPARPSVAVACVSFGTKCFLSKSLSATGFICVSFLTRCGAVSVCASSLISIRFGRVISAGRLGDQAARGESLRKHTDCAPGHRRGVLGLYAKAGRQGSGEVAAAVYKADGERRSSVVQGQQDQPPTGAVAAKRALREDETGEGLPVVLRVHRQRWRVQRQREGAVDLGSGARP
jgi:hypothetical protein